MQKKKKIKIEERMNYLIKLKICLASDETEIFHINYTFKVRIVSVQLTLPVARNLIC